MIFLTDIFKELVEERLSTRLNRSIYFNAGNYNEVTRDLTEKEQGVETKLEKYPFVWLVMDYTEEVRALEIRANLRFIIAQETVSNISTLERIETVFKPVLAPIYEGLLLEIARSGSFNVGGFESIEHKRILHPYWGTSDSGKKSANIFNDYVDVIEIKDMNLIINKIC